MAQETVLSPRGNPNSPNFGGPISGMDLIKLHDTSLHFHYEHMPVKQGIPKTLVVPHCNAIKWSYTLNTSVQSTYGGEVIQALSCFAGPITITGQVADHYLRAGDPTSYRSAAEELLRIYYWFRVYMLKAAGAGKSVTRDETAIHFTYPERNWSMWIQPTALRSFSFGTERLGQEWEIEAEVMTDNDLNYFAKATMNSFTDSLLDPTLVQGDKLGIGFAGDPRTDPTANPAANPQRFGDNFQRLLGAWSSGDFAHWGFNELTAADQNGLTADASSYWHTIFGSDGVSLGGSSGGTESVGISGAGASSGLDSQSGIVIDIVAAFEAVGIPGDIAVADAIHESGLDPTARAVNDGGTGIDGVGLFQVHAPGGAKDTPMIRDASSGAGRSKSVTDTYPASIQITDAASWWSAHLRDNSQLDMHNDDDKAQLAMISENFGAGAAYANAVKLLLPQARDLIKKASNTTPTSTDYANPLRGVQGLIAMRVDQGVDYACSSDSPIYAIGPGTISYAQQTGTGWPGSESDSQNGGFISYTLSAGPAKGLTVYVAEHITLANLNVGDPVTADTVLCTMHPGFPNIETGWGQRSVPAALAQNVWAGHDSEGYYTAYGKNFSDLLVSLGAPAGTISPGARELGTSDIPNWQ